MAHTFVVKRPGEAPTTVETGNDLKSLQALVGGYIELVVIEVWVDGRIRQLDMFCNEEGQRLELAPNVRLMSGRTGDFSDVLGPVFVAARGGEDDTETVGLTPAEVAGAIAGLTRMAITPPPFAEGQIVETGTRGTDAYCVGRVVKCDRYGARIEWEFPHPDLGDFVGYEKLRLKPPDPPLPLFRVRLRECRSGGQEWSVSARGRDAVEARWHAMVELFGDKAGFWVQRVEQFGSGTDSFLGQVTKYLGNDTSTCLTGIVRLTVEREVEEAS